MVTVRRGEIWWGDLREPQGSEPGYTRPVLVVQDDSFNHSRLATVIVLNLTGNLGHANAPGNIPLSKKVSRLEKDSVINVTQVTAIDKCALDQRVSRLPEAFMAQVDAGLKLVLGLEH